MALHACGIGVLALALRSAATAGWRSLHAPARPSAITFATAVAPTAVEPMLPPEVVVEAVAPAIVEPCPLEFDVPAAPLEPAVSTEPPPTAAPTLAWFTTVVRRGVAPPPPTATSAIAPASPEPPAAAPASDGGMVLPSPVASENAPPRYPFVAWRRGVEGTVVIELAIDRDGVVTGARIVQSSGSRALDEAARDRLATWRFAPARNRFGPVACTQRQSVVFRLRDQDVSVGAAAH